MKRVLWRSILNRICRPHSKIIRTLNPVIALFGVLYLLILCFPEAVFAHSLSYKHFQVYATTLVTPRIRAVLDETDRKLTASPINDPSITHHLFLCPNRAAFGALYPVGVHALAFNVPVVHNIFVRPANISQDIFLRDEGPARASILNGTRTLGGTLAHECTHTLLENRFGFVGCRAMPAWKNEGYCDYVADQHAYDAVLGLSLLRRRRSDPAPAFVYFKYWLAVKYLMDVRKLTVDQLISDTESLDEVVAKAISASVTPLRH